jgi:hypothetical protein
MSEIDRYYVDQEKTRAAEQERTKQEKYVSRLKLIKFLLPLRLEDEMTEKRGDYKWVKTEKGSVVSWPLNWSEYGKASINLFQNGSLGYVTYSPPNATEGIFEGYVTPEELSADRLAALFTSMSSRATPVDGIENGSLLSFNDTHWHHAWAKKNREEVLQSLGLDLEDEETNS